MSLIEVVTQILASIDARLINLALYLSNILALVDLVNSVPLHKRTSVLNESPDLRMERRSRKVNRVLEQARVGEVLGILRKVAHELGNRKVLSRDNELTRVTGGHEAFLCQTSLPWRKVTYEPETLRTMPPSQVYV